MYKNKRTQEIFGEVYSSIGSIEDKIFSGLQCTIEDCAEIFRANASNRREGIEEIESRSDMVEWITARDYILGLKRVIQNTRQRIRDKQSERLLEELCEAYNSILQKRVSRIEAEIKEKEGSHPLTVLSGIGYISSLVPMAGAIHYALMGDMKSAGVSLFLSGLAFASSTYVRYIVIARTNGHKARDDIKNVKQYADSVSNPEIMLNIIYKRYEELQRLLPEII